MLAGVQQLDVQCKCPSLQLPSADWQLLNPRRCCSPNAEAALVAAFSSSHAGNEEVCQLLPQTAMTSLLHMGEPPGPSCSSRCGTPGAQAELADATKMPLNLDVVLTGPDQGCAAQHGLAWSASAVRAWQPWLPWLTCHSAAGPCGAHVAMWKRAQMPVACLCSWCRPTAGQVPPKTPSLPAQGHGEMG